MCVWLTRNWVIVPCAVCVRNWIIYSDMEYCIFLSFLRISAHSCRKSIPITCLMKNWQVENKSNSDRFMDTHIYHVCLQIWNLKFEHGNNKIIFYLEADTSVFGINPVLFPLLSECLCSIVHVYAVDYGIFTSILISVSNWYNEQHIWWLQPNICWQKMSFAECRNSE